MMISPRRHEPLRVLSLFSGIGGIDLGLERAGMTVVAHSEIDPYANRVLAQHWPGVPNLGDINSIKVGDAAFIRRVGAVLEVFDHGGIDVIAGGFPCQDISLAGKGAGIVEGETRSGLWHEYARLVRDLQPRYVIVENVAALVARGLDTVLGSLAALGYDAWWDCIPAASVGAPHRRDRVFIVASRADVAPIQPACGPIEWASSTDSKIDAGKCIDRQRQEVRNEPAVNGAKRAADADANGERGYGRAGELGTDWRSVTAGGSGTGATPSDAGSLEYERRGAAERGSGTEGVCTTGESTGNARNSDSASEDAHSAPSASRHSVSESGWWSAEPSVGRVAHGVPKRVDRLRCLGNAVVPQVAQYIGELVVAAHERSES